MLTCNFIYVAEVGTDNSKNILTIALCLKSCLSLNNLNRVNIKRIKMSFPFKCFKHLRGMSAIAKCSIKPLFSGLNFKHLQNLINHYGNMHSRRGTSLAYNLLYCILVFFRIVFFIFFTEFLRMSTTVAYSSLMCIF